jgi:hypothetical protein
VNWQDALAIGHVLAALAALSTGAANLLLRKGTSTHRAVGTAYGSALVTVNVAALFLHRENVFGVFHALAIPAASRITRPIGGRRSRRCSLPISGSASAWKWALWACCPIGVSARSPEQDRSSYSV